VKAEKVALGSANSDGNSEVVRRLGSGLYQLLVESVGDYAIFALDSAGNIVTWNRGAENLKGYEANEIIGRHFSVFYGSEDIELGKPAREIAEAIEFGRVEDEGWRLRKDGTQFWASVVITALRDSTGMLVGFAKVTRDLTERRRAETELRESEERFRLLVEGVRDYGIFMLDIDGRIASWNEGARRIKGYDAEEILGRHFSTFYPEADIESNKPAWELEVAARDGRFEDEGWRIRKDGTRFWANVIITAVRNRSGTLIGFAKITRDLTERRASEETAMADARRLAEAEGANRAKSEFLAALSHELRTPLHAIAGYAELMEIGATGSLSDQQLDYLARIRRGQKHLLAIVSDLLNISRIEAGRQSYAVSDVPVPEIIQETIALVTPQADRKGLTVRGKPCPPGLSVRADKVKLDQILINIMSNAVKFTPSGGTIEIECSRIGDHVSFTVRDSGPGIASNQQANIFEPFVQLGRDASVSPDGTGLGLSISRHLARAMHGDISVRSAPGKGSTFILTLPAGTEIQG